MEDEFVIVAVSVSLTLHGAMAAFHHLRERAGNVIRHANRGAYMRDLNRAVNSHRRNDPPTRL